MSHIEIFPSGQADGSITSPRTLRGTFTLQVRNRSSPHNAHNHTNILNAAFVSMRKWRNYIRGKGLSPSSVFKVRPIPPIPSTQRVVGNAEILVKTKYVVTKVFEDDGTLASGTTTAFVDSKRARLYLHGMSLLCSIACSTSDSFIYEP